MKQLLSILAIILATSSFPQMGHVDKNTKHVITCAVTGEKLDQDWATKYHMFSDYKGNRYFFCCGGCPKTVKKNPAKYEKAAHIPIPKPAKG
jgi:YHS domain-containing protein